MKQRETGAHNPPAGGVSAPPAVVLPGRQLLWLIGIRLVVITTLLLGALIIQVTTRMILPLGGLYMLVLATYSLSLLYVGLFARGVRRTVQVAVQLVGDIAIVTGFVYVTGGLYSPFSFLYLIVIAAAALLLRGGGLIFAGLSAVAYGLMVDLIVFHLVPFPPNLVGQHVVLPSSRVLYQLLIHVVGFVLIAVLVSYLSESLRTAHDRLEEEQRRSQQYAALTDHVVRSVTAGILAVDLNGGVLHLNPAGSLILHVEHPEQTTGRPISEIMALEAVDWGLLLARAGFGQPVRLEAPLSGGHVRLGLTIGPLNDAQDRRVGFVVNFQDLSELERANERERLQERMAAIGEMAARVAHEIKNPLASISGSAQMLVTHEGVEATAHRLLGIIVDESQRLSHILDGFLDYTRPRPTTMESCDLAPLLKDCVELLGSSDETRPSHHIVLDIPEHLTLEGDEDLLRQVLWNLSLNALQAMPEGGTLAIAARSSGSSATLTWSDTGCGMPEEIRTRAFEPFVTTHQSGTGLGLAIAYAVVDEHGGSIDIESVSGRGTTVSVTLPLKARSGTPTPSEAETGGHDLSARRQS